MPRQLPWANKSGGSRAQTKSASSRQATKLRNTAATDDDFFDDTVLASSKDRSDESDDDLPGLPAEPSTPQTKARTKDALRRKREGSSSPPPIDDLEQPLAEGMHKGISKFDLRDDEWMMVEDEFLETAKLFTRHLHIAEYEKLKATIEEKKKEAAGIARPVVANAKRSTSGAMKEKARVQELKQEKAIRDVFASQEEEEDDKEEHAMLSSRINLTPAFMSSRNNVTPASKGTPGRLATQDSDNDSDDLDAPRLPKQASKATTTPTPARKISTAGEQNSASPPAPDPRPPNPTFAKPTPPTSAAKSRSRLSRATPFDMLDDWVPNKSKALSQSSQEQPAKTSHTSRAPTTVSHSQPPASTVGRGDAKFRRSIVSFDEDVPTRDQSSDKGSGVSKKIMDRLAKRKAEREKDEKERKRKVAKLDDIPTFLF
ncbi:hypothetical protein G6011_09646 [Alternaria panax]|uniref:Uncharacterized protein n=1 Tax=Alternaria panax TaxID=48097 RepID=A0AAD4I5I9_9PLEO|nr:hypothetical protein G6011_09646 [Alternaria panax]